MCAEGDHDETEQGRRSQSRRLNEDGSWSCHPHPPRAEAEIAPLPPQSHVGILQPMGTSPKDPLAAQGQAQLSMRAAKLLSFVWVSREVIMGTLWILVQAAPEAWTTANELRA